MPKKLNFNAKQFISDYQSQNNIGYTYTIRELAAKYKISLFSVNTYRKLFGLSRGKGNSRYKCKTCKYEFEVCICGGVTLGIAHG
jgi:transposase-like protein